MAAKYRDVPFGEMMDCAVNDLPIICRHFASREPLDNELDVRPPLKHMETGRVVYFSVLQSSRCDS